MYEVNVSSKAEKQLKRLPKHEARKVVEKIRFLARTSRPDGCKKLSGTSTYFPEIDSPSTAIHGSSFCPKSIRSLERERIDFSIWGIFPLIIVS